jgi:hypothetical protein
MVRIVGNGDEGVNRRIAVPWGAARPSRRPNNASMVYWGADPPGDAAQKHLGNGMVKGIGPDYVKKLLDKIDEQVCDVIQKESARLQEFARIGPKRSSDLTGVNERGSEGA